MRVGCVADTGSASVALRHHVIVVGRPHGGWTPCQGPLEGGECCVVSCRVVPPRGVYPPLSGVGRGGLLVSTNVCN